MIDFHSHIHMPGHIHMYDILYTYVHMSCILYDEKTFTEHSLFKEVEYMYF